MSEGDRQFEATAARLRKAREEGDVPRSADFCGAIAFSAGVIALTAVFPLIATFSVAALRDAAAERRSDIVLLGGLFATIALFPIAASACGALLSGIAQTGGVRLRFPALSCNRLNMVAGLRHTFSRESIMAMMRGFFALVCISAIMIPLIYRVMAQTVRSDGALALASVAWQGAICVGFAAAMLAVGFGGVDFAVSLGRWRRRLRMTLEEFKRDQKESEGDPLLRSRRRAAQRQLSRSAMRRVAEAAFVVVNPTHIAIALEYRPPEISVPCVLIRACDYAAVR
ncbi:MAG: EscU/YscU/HrcU family type III secretion system export apparatus switch protein, partial [Candidatus Eremiobacteraeota bacterium]|nr:EscU/YscU/HrcU family type III secretion system export apparatus switch protein [Candidatus Eremiobacteraeota bacterium]